MFTVFFGSHLGVLLSTTSKRKENHYWLQIKVFCSVGCHTYLYPAPGSHGAITMGRFPLCGQAGSKRDGIPWRESLLRTAAVSGSGFGCISPLHLVGSLSTDTVRWDETTLSIL